jgi:hypothetical protein
MLLLSGTEKKGLDSIMLDEHIKQPEKMQIEGNTIYKDNAQNGSFNSNDTIQANTQFPIEIMNKLELSFCDCQHLVDLPAWRRPKLNRNVATLVSPQGSPERPVPKSVYC